MRFDIDDPNILDQWQEIVEIMARLMDVPTAIITRVLPPYIEVFKANQNPNSPYSEGVKVRLAGHYCEEVIKAETKLLVPNAPDLPQWSDAPELEHGMVSYMGYPVFRPDGEIFGTICVLDQQPNAYSQDYADLLKQFKTLVEGHLLLMQQKRELEDQMREIRVLRGMIPICMNCKKIRNDDGYWEKVESYIESHTDVEFSHGLCESCMQELYGDQTWYQQGELRREVEIRLHRGDQTKER